jgi:type VI protein secretion system component Hcp
MNGKDDAARKLDKVTFDFTNGTGQPLQVELKNVRIIALNTDLSSRSSASGASVPMETVSMSFASMEITHPESGNNVMLEV